MKKILISLLILLLIIITCIAIFKGIKFAKVKSIHDIKSASTNLDNDIEGANQLANQTYPSKTQTLDEAIKALKLAKQEYENKNPYGDDVNIGALEVKTYKIHYLWTILGNYRKDEGVRSLNLDLKSTANKDVYDLQFTLVGNYLSITDFLYDIENDGDLKFETKNFKITASDDSIARTSSSSSSALKTNTTNTSTNTNTNKTSTTTTKASTKDASEGGTILKATFTVTNIGITLD